MGYNANRQQPISMKVDRVGNPADKIIDYSYEYYDAQGKNNNRIRTITDNVDSPFTVNYLYDDYNRLTSATAGFYFRFYYHDAFGNITNFSAQAQNYALNATGAPATNRILNVNGGAAFSYDNAGNLTAGEGQGYAYDGASRLSSVNGGAAGQYGYDGDGMRVKKVESGATLFYIRSSKLGNVAFEVTSTSVQRAYVNAGGKTIAQLSTDGQFYWLHTNHLGSARAMTDTSGNLVYKGQFDPYGQTVAEWSATGNTSLNTKKFTGYERDATGLDYAEARTYTGGRGRFMQPDPKGVGAVKPGRPQSLNRYSYVGNDPVNYVDPFGTNDVYILCLWVGETVIDDWWYDVYSCNALGGDTPGERLEPREPVVQQGAGGPPVRSQQEIQKEALTKGINTAKSILNNSVPCSSLFGGYEVLNDTNITFEAVAPGSRRPDGSTIISQAYYLPNSGWIVINTYGGFVDGKDTISLGPGVTSRESSDTGGLSLDEFRAQILLHELGHLLGVLEVDGGDAEASSRNSRKISDACFNGRGPR